MSIRMQREVEGEIHPLIILFSAVADKDYSHMIELLCRELKADAYVIAKVDNKRGAQADTLAALFRKYTDRPVYREDTLADAFTRALNEKGSEGKLYCLGSLYLGRGVKRTDRRRRCLILKKNLRSSNQVWK